MSKQVVLITGALTGIGRATAVVFVAAGANIVVSGAAKRRAKNSRRNCANSVPKHSL